MGWLNCAKCKIQFHLPDTLYETMRQLGDQGTFYCPIGHPQWFPHGETEESKLRRERDRLIQEQARLHDRIREEREGREATERKNTATRGVVTRMKNRAANGVCLCCNRTFTNLQKHMETKHPQFKKEDAV